jgi:hypothetical protein
MFREPTNRFDRDLDAILNRVYGSDASNRMQGESNPAAQRQMVFRREQGSIELKQALADLRGRRERSQSVMRMKEEVDYLEEQIAKLRELTETIDSLRVQLAEEDAEA